MEFEENERKTERVQKGETEKMRWDKVIERGDKGN